MAEYRNIFQELHVRCRDDWQSNPIHWQLNIDFKTTWVEVQKSLSPSSESKTYLALAALSRRAVVRFGGVFSVSESSDRDTSESDAEASFFAPFLAGFWNKRRHLRGRYPAQFSIKVTNGHSLQIRTLGLFKNIFSGFRELPKNTAQQILPDSNWQMWTHTS